MANDDYTTSRLYIDPPESKAQALSWAQFKAHWYHLVNTPKNPQLDHYGGRLNLKLKMLDQVQEVRLKR